MKKERNQLVLLTYGEVGNFRMRPPSTTPTGTLLVERTFDHHMRPIELPDGSWAVQSTAGGKGGTWLTPPMDKETAFDLQEKINRLANGWLPEG